MTASLITDRKQFLALCRHISKAGLVGFDTEFVSEHTYRPELGLLQFATEDQSVAVDPYEVGDLSPWWKIMADDKTTIIVHGGQAEFRFCLTLFGQRPQKTVDVQLAEGFRSGSYPVSYSSLVRSVLGKRVHGGETRTDWRKRPLSEKQLKYALEDVGYLLPVWSKQEKQLKGRKRVDWVTKEVEQMICDLEAALSRETWTRVSGINQLSPRELAVVRELAQWREREADKTNRPPRRLLRDDLLVELARRQPKTMKDLMRTRDMNRSNYKKLAGDYLKCIETALALPDDECPEPPRSRHPKSKIDDRTLGQLLGMVLGHLCDEQKLYRQIVATTDELKAFVRWHVAGRKGDPPQLAVGWRAEVCGNLLTDILEGKLSVRVGNASDKHPLAFEKIG